MNGAGCINSWCEEENAYHEPDEVTDAHVPIPLLIHRKKVLHRLSVAVHAACSRAVNMKRFVHAVGSESIA